MKLHLVKESRATGMASPSLIRENVGLLLKVAGALVTQDMAKADMPNAFFAQSLTVRLAFRSPRSWRQALFILQFAAKKGCR